MMFVGRMDVDAMWRRGGEGNPVRAEPVARAGATLREAVLERLEERGASDPRLREDGRGSTMRIRGRQPVNSDGQPRAKH